MIAVDTGYAALIRTASRKWSVPEGWFYGIITVESSWREDALSGTGDFGLMQINGSIADAYGVDYADLFDPAVNIDTGGRLLNELIGRFGLNLDSVLSAYNSGGANNWRTNPVVANYVSKVKAAIPSDFAGGAVQASDSALRVVLVILGGVALWRLFYSD